MKELFAKLTLYDILVMLIPGGAILVFIALSWNFELTIGDAKIAPVLAWMIMLTLAYLIGIVNHVATSVLWLPFRNCSYMINKARIKIYGEKTDDYNISKKGKCFCFVFMPILMVVLIGMWFVCKEYAGCSLGRIMILLIVYTVAMLIGLAKSVKYKCLGHRKDEGGGKDGSELMEKYYEAYYFLLKSRYLGDISIMEGQVAFMQSMIIPLCLFSFLPCDVLCRYVRGHVCEVRILILSLVVLLVFTICLRQQKIYTRVWEDARYLKNHNGKKSI
ncbi:unknown [Alistipes sp. CAG:831]|nr:unknown [Alistipes sp. CAG:831]